MFMFACCVPSCSAQYPDEWPSTEAPPSFEIYGLASGMSTVDPIPRVVINNPAPGQDVGFRPSGFASGTRVGFVWRLANVGLVADLGFHKYADHTGSTSLAPLMLGLRLYSDEHFRTSTFAEGMAGAYRWTQRSTTANFSTVKGIVGIGAGMDIRLTRRLVFRVGEFQLMIPGGGSGLTGSVSSGLAIRF